MIMSSVRFYCILLEMWCGGGQLQMSFLTLCNPDVTGR